MHSRSACSSSASHAIGPINPHALRTVGLVLRALDRESLPGKALLVLIFELTDRASGRRKPGRSCRF